MMTKSSPVSITVPGMATAVAGVSSGPRKRNSAPRNRSNWRQKGADERLWLIHPTSVRLAAPARRKSGPSSCGWGSELPPASWLEGAATATKAVLTSVAIIAATKPIMIHRFGIGTLLVGDIPLRPSHRSGRGAS